MQKTNKMATMPVGKLLTTMSLPIIISMIVQSLYNVVDSIFVSYISQDALTAVSLVFPVQFLVLAVGIGTGIGMNSLLSRKLGQGNHKEASEVAKNTIFICFIVSIVFAVVGALLSQEFIAIFTDKANVIDMGTQYMTVVTIFSFTCIYQIINERIIQSTGDTIYILAIQGIGAVINIILDPIFIFALDLGVQGAAIATVIGQSTAMCIGFYINSKKNKHISLSVKGFKPNKTIIKEIYKVGLPAIVMQSLMSVMTLAMNYILIPFSDIGVAVYSIYIKMNSFVFMPLFGVTNAMVPIIAYNYGAKNKKRIIKALKLSMIFAVVLMIAGTIVFQVFPATLMNMFNASDELISTGVVALRTISLSFTLSGICIVFSTFFQAVGNGVYSLIISFIRQLIIILPAAFILIRMGGINSVWWAFVISEFVALVLCIVLFMSIKKKTIDLLPNN